MTALELLRELEWSGVRYGAPSAMHLSNGPVCEACPKCHGVKPDGRGRGEFTASTFGHRPDCPFPGLIGEYAELIGAKP